MLALEADASFNGLSGYQAEIDINWKLTRRLVMEELSPLRLPTGKRDDKVQTFGVQIIRKLAADLKEYSFLEAHRKLLGLEPPRNHGASADPQSAID